MTAEKSLIHFAMSKQYNDLPAEVVSGTKRLIMNIIAALIAGSSAKSVSVLANLIKGAGGSPEATVFLNGFRAPSYESVLVNASMARAVDFDDFHMQTGMHASATVIPVALATAEALGKVDGKAIISAIALGIELLCRMRLVPDLCIGISGWTGEIYGAFGAALTAGRLFALSEEQMGNALGLSYAQAAGNAQSIYDGTEATILQQGFSARAGFFAAVMAKAGLTGAKNFLSGKAGLYPVYYRGLNYDIGRLTSGLGDRYELLNIVTKPYPSCGFTMAPIENVIGIMKENQLDAQDIENVKICVNRKMYNTVCHPLDNKYRPKSASDAMFSLPYVVATAVLNGDVILEDFSSEAIREPERLRLMERIKIEMDENIEKEALETNLPLGLHQIDLKIRGGKRFSRKMQYSKGFPQQPMTLEECAMKAIKSASVAVNTITVDRIAALKNIIEHLEEINDIRQFTDLLS